MQYHTMNKRNNDYRIHTTRMYMYQPHVAKQTTEFLVIILIQLRQYTN